MLAAAAMWRIPNVM